MDAVEKSRPFALTAPLGTGKACVFILLTLLVYIGCGATVVFARLYQLDPIRADDHFVDGPDTRRYFVTRAAERAFETYSDYIAKFFYDGKRVGLTLDQLLREQGKPLTTVHVAEDRREEYGWDYQVPQGARK